MSLRTDGGFFVSYSLQVLAVLVRERRSSIVRDRRSVRSPGLRRRVAAGFYALAKAVTVLAVVLDDEPVCVAAGRAK